MKKYDCSYDLNDNLLCFKEKIFRGDNDGKKEELNAEQIIIELASDKQITIDLRPHPSGLTIGEIVDPKSDVIPTHFSVISVRPSACNIIHADIERHQLSEEQKEQMDLEPQVDEKVL